MRRSFTIGAAAAAVAATITLLTVGDTQATAPRGADPCATEPTTSVETVGSPAASPTATNTPLPNATEEPTPSFDVEVSVPDSSAPDECDDEGAGAGLPDSGTDSSSIVPIGMVVLTAGLVLIGVSSLRRSRRTA